LCGLSTILVGWYAWWLALSTKVDTPVASLSIYSAQLGQSPCDFGRFAITVSFHFLSSGTYRL
jgi:hypothetical protein